MASIRTVLVQLDASDAAPPRLRSALAVAARHAAVLTGVFVAEPPPAPLATALSDEPAGLLARADRASYERARALFERLRGETAVPMRWQEPGGGGGVADLLAQAPCADLLVIGAHDGAHAEGPPAGLAECVLATTGRPVLLLPPGVELPAEPRTVLVGWDASPAAVHALVAAQPWLETAHRVLVLDGSPPAAEEDTGIRWYLQCHRVSAERVPRPRAGEPAGEALLELTRRASVDLLVMGGQGHGALRELLFGGAAHTVLRRPPVALLMAH